jgi:hypothetical protein
MTLRTVPLDTEFQSGLLNFLELVDPDALILGEDFLFPKIFEGRLEFVEAINQTMIGSKVIQFPSAPRN